MQKDVGEIIHPYDSVTPEEDEVLVSALRYELAGQVNTQKALLSSCGVSGDGDLPRQRPALRPAGFRVGRRLGEDTCHQFIIWDVSPERIRGKSQI